MKKIFLLIAIVTSVVITSCTRVYPLMVTSNAGLKEGKVEKTVWFHLAMNVDLSVATAAKNGGINKIATVDYGVKGGLFNKTYFIRVTGE